MAHKISLSYVTNAGKPILEILQLFNMCLCAVDQATILNPFQIMEYKMIKKITWFKTLIEVDILCINLTLYVPLDWDPDFVSNDVTIWQLNDVTNEHHSNILCERAWMG